MISHPLARVQLLVNATGRHRDMVAIETLIAFKVMLRNINLLYLFCGVLVLADLSYVSRFWTQFEAFLSLRQVRRRVSCPQLRQTAGA